MYRSGCGEEETGLVFTFWQRYFKTVKSEFVDACNDKPQEHEIQGQHSADRPQAFVNTSSVCAFRTVADMRALMLE